MVEKIYDTIRAIIYSEFPLNSQGQPAVYDRQIDSWFFGDRKIQPAALGVVLKGTNSGLKDIGYGFREIEYSIGITFFSSNDDQETSERVVQEAARVLHEILKNHRVMWICDLCPFCDQLPLSPIHYIDNGTVTAVGITSAVLPPNANSYLVTITPVGVGLTAPAYIRLSPGISGNVTVSEILSGGLGIQSASYADSYANLTLTISGGNPHVGYSTTYINSYVTNVINQINGFWQETHTTSSPTYYDWAGVAFQAIQELSSDWAAGIQTSGTWTSNMNNIITNKVNLMRLLQSVQVGDIKPSDDGIDQAFLHTAEFTIKAKEIINVSSYGPNNVNVNAV
jgi:hypothetical protein